MSLLANTPSPFQSPSAQPAFCPVSYLPAAKTCTKSALLNSPSRLASPYQVCFRFLTQN